MSVSPLAQSGLNEALGLAVGPWALGFGQALLEAESVDGGAHEMAAITGAVVAVEPLRGDAVTSKEGQRGVQEADGTGGGLIGPELSEGDAGMIIDAS